MSASEVIARLLRAAEEADERIRSVEEGVERETSRLLALADELAQRLAAETDRIIEEYRGRIIGEARRRAEEIEREYRRRIEEESRRLREAVEARREAAVEAALEALAAAVRGGAG